MRLVRASAVKEGLTLQQFGILRLLHLRGALQMNAFSDELRVSPPVITGIVDRLELKSLVERKANTTDRRRTDIALTDEGESMYRRIQSQYRRSLQESLARSLTPEEQKTLVNLLRRFSKEIENPLI